jgi:hypothetical protein
VTGGVLNAAMLAGLLAAVVPLIIHLLDRRRDPVIDWGAMQFLDIGSQARRRLRFTELLLMLARMSLLAIVALALARPYLRARGPLASGSRPGRDVVLIIDGSASMERKLGTTTPWLQALSWAREFLARLEPADSVAILIAGDRVRPVIDAPSFDRGKILDALKGLETTTARGASNLPLAVAESFRVLERTGNPARDVVILSDSQRSAWRPGDRARWSLLRDLHRRLPIAPRLWGVSFGRRDATSTEPELPNGSVGPPTVSRSLITPSLPLTVSAEVRNAGPGLLNRSAALLVDGLPSTAPPQVAGPLAEGERVVVSFKTALSSAGSHLLTIRLAGSDDSLPGDDEASVAVEVVSSLGVLLVDGEPAKELLGGETDFVRAALAPMGDDTPEVRTQVVTTEYLSAAVIQGMNVVVLANVERLTPEQLSALGRFIELGGGLIVAPGDRTDASFFNAQRWMPAEVGAATGDFAARRVVAHPSPSTFTGPVLTAFGQGNNPALAEVGLFSYRRLEPAPESLISARLDTGEPWTVECAHGKGRVLLLAGPLDAEGGTLPVNPDFVPLMHEWTLHLARGVSPGAGQPGVPLEFNLDRLPGNDVRTLPLRTPGGLDQVAVVTRTAGRSRARFEDTAESGVYRLTLPDPPGGFAYATVQSDGLESDLATLEPREQVILAEGWPLVFAEEPSRFAAMILSAGGSAATRELWRGLVLAALGMVCIEIYLTRRLARGHGPSR